MTKEFEKKIKEAKNEEELLKILDSMNGEELTDEEMELIVGGSNECGFPNIDDKIAENQSAQYACENQASLNRPWQKK
ncbi:MAG: hypothetical protein MJ041_02655 [Acidaminococcaceae bacterium]|nr:hypothetical protein [Acidaminococcaceae bacterium]